MSTDLDVDADVGRELGPSGAYIWFAVASPIGFWMVHLIGMASMARIACTNPGWIWVVHGFTVAMAAVTLVAMAMCEHLRRAAPSSDVEPGDPAIAGAGRDGAVVTTEGFANLEFLGKFGLLLGAANLLLIVFEGSMAVWLKACH